MNEADLKEMDRQILEDLLKEKQDKLEEVEEEKKFVLSQSGRHLPGTIRQDYKNELQQIEKQIETIREVLAEKNN